MQQCGRIDCDDSRTVRMPRPARIVIQNHGSSLRAYCKLHYLFYGSLLLKRCCGAHLIWVSTESHRYQCLLCIDTSAKESQSDTSITD